ncbi:hypothetical protein ACQP2T_42635 [Nonomuraea sp. CA-143628]|uniref:hypothetical protein n=1 Tax=Nonomuraea sp. CA-143628 TaxID=3239997 RepID=UPI003D949BA9
MDNPAEVCTFLRSRRDKITPEEAGLPAYGQRRVPGLRRGEVATLAGVSVEYYSADPGTPDGWQGHRPEWRDAPAVRHRSLISCVGRQRCT